MSWIDVADRLPIKDGKKLCVVLDFNGNGGVCTELQMLDFHKADYTWERTNGIVLQWAPLPELSDTNWVSSTSRMPNTLLRDYLCVVLLSDGFGRALKEIQILGFREASWEPINGAVLGWMPLPEAPGYQGVRWLGMEEATIVN